MARPSERRVKDGTFRRNSHASFMIGELVVSFEATTKELPSIAVAITECIGLKRKDFQTTRFAPTGAKKSRAQPSHQ